MQDHDDLARNLQQKVTELGQGKILGISLGGGGHDQRAGHLVRCIVGAVSVGCDKEQRDVVLIRAGEGVGDEANQLVVGRVMLHLHGVATAVGRPDPP